MASSPVPIADKASRKTSAPKPPLTANPAFRWVVALWFAALLGVGSMIVPVALLENAITATGLAAIVPQAAPPLGFTAQALVALVGTVGGAVLGLLLARMVARGGKTKSVDAEPVRRALSASEDLADFDDLDARAAAIGRRRSLAIDPEEGPSDFLQVAPVPAVKSREEIAEVEEIDQHWEDARAAEPVRAEAPRQVFQPDPQFAAEEEPFELDASAELTGPQDEFDHAAAAEELAEEPQIERQEFIAVADAEMAMVEEEEAAPAPPRQVFEPLAFSPPSMARPAVSYDNEIAQAADEDDSEYDEAEDDSDEFAGFEMAQDADPESEEDVSDKPIFDAPAAAQGDNESGEGLVQLVQRLGATLDKHREWSAERVAVAAPAVAAESHGEHAERAPVPEEFDPAAADDAAQAMAAWFGSPAAAPGVQAAGETPDEPAAAGLQYAPFAGGIAAAVHDDEDEEEDDMVDLAASFTLPSALRAEAVEQVELVEEAAAANVRPAFDRPPVAAAPVIGEAAEESHEEEADDSADSAEYGSLNPFRDKHEEFVRIDEPEPEEDSVEPAVLFPGQEARRTPSARAFDPPAGHGGAPAPRADRPRPSNDDNERALREALLNLQRMSK